MARLWAEVAAGAQFSCRHRAGIVGTAATATAIWLVQRTRKPGPLHIVAASRGLRLLLRAAPALPVAGEVDDRARTMVSVA